LIARADKDSHIDSVKVCQDDVLWSRWHMIAVGHKLVHIVVAREGWLQSQGCIRRQRTQWMSNNKMKGHYSY